MPSANPARGSAVLDRDQQSHGIYQIISGLQDGQGAAAVFAGSRRLFVATAHTVPDAVEDAKTSIAMRLRTFQAERQPGMASAGELRDLLDSFGEGRRLRLVPLLLTHARRPAATATAHELALRLRRDSGLIWEEYRWFGRKIVSALGVRPGPSCQGVPRDSLPISAFARVDRKTIGDQWTIRLLDPVLAAIQ